MPIYKISTDAGRTYLYDSDKSEICIDGESKPLVFRPPFNYKKTPDYGKLARIVLGMKCNYDCAYCSQAFAREEVVGGSLKDVDTFLARAKEWLPGAGRVEFWGGEPLVYIKHLKRLIPALRDILPDAEFHIITNGALLTDEIGDFLAAHRVYVAVSHDAYAQKITRGKDPLDDQELVEVIKRTFKKVNKAVADYSGDPTSVCCMNATLTKHSMDPVAIKLWFDKKFGEPIPVSCDCIMSIGGAVGNEDMLMSPAELMRLCENVAAAGLNIPRNSPYSITGKVSDFIRAICDATPISEATAFCGATHNSIQAVDLQGNTYACQNRIGPDKIVSSVYTDPDKKAGFSDYRSRRCCSNCPVAMVCRGACSLAGVDKNAFAETCETKFWYSMGIFVAAFARLTGDIPVKIEGNIVRPVKELVQTAEGSERVLNEVTVFSL